ncbi:predicted protein [Chaetoceros tenuissimus]|uniref:Uncharacterized protein n=1 Tax=Chaetoceros tenuissimus TaxID=426638 RepID=A0AAD3D9U5_9STRA|nr:predicted protein [Chaetoceros tenuissimus]
MSQSEMKRGDSFNSDTLLSMDSSSVDEDEGMPDTEMEPECIDEDMEESIQDHALDPIQEKEIEEEEDTSSPEKKVNRFKQSSRVLQYTKSIQKKKYHTEMRQKIKSRKSEAVPKLISFWEGSSHDDCMASDDHGDLSKVPRLISFWEGGTMKKKSENNEDVTIEYGKNH